MRLVTLFLLAFTSLVAYSSVEEVPMVCGEALMSGKMTYDEAKAKALQEAKIEALRRAGVEETVRSNQMLGTQQINKSFEQQFSEFANTEISGDIVSYEILKEGPEPNKGGSESNKGGLIFRTCITAKVKKYDTKRDLKFELKVDSLSNKYYQGEALTFSLLPYKEGYLHAFLMDNNHNADLIFPNYYEKNNLLKENTRLRLPYSKKLQYTLTKNNPKGNAETNYLILVYTKENIPFTEKISPESILKWIANIEPSERVVKTESILIW